MRRPVLIAVLALAATARAEDLAVDPDAGNSTFSAIFDAALGERINAQSAAVACKVSLDERTGAVSGSCSVPLTSVRVDNEDTKTDHFRQWVTNKKSDPEDCRLEAVFRSVKLGKLVAERPVPFEARIPFTVCGRGPVDGRAEHVKGTAVLFPPGSYGAARTIRVRATIQGFDRDAYHIGPKYTEGWLARVQSLAKVVAEKGTVELTLFARPAPEAAER